MNHLTKKLALRALGALTLGGLMLAAAAGCAGPSKGGAAAARSSKESGADHGPEEAAASTRTRLVALLPMREGYGPADHDQYETTIAPIAKDHGMALDTAYTVTKFLKGRGPQHASTFGVWGLSSSASLKGVMNDARYREHVGTRDRIHDMPQAAMYMTIEEPVEAEARAGDTILAGFLVMNEGYGFDDHAKYEENIGHITERHGMRLIRAFRVMKALGEAAPVHAINVWALSSPKALKGVMSDPEYVANIENRDRLHDMSATTMYFVTYRAQ